jgi:hypothetical protein
MRPKWLLAALGVPALAAVAFLSFRPATKADQPNKGGVRAEAAPAVQLPIAQVVLYSSGVGYFQRRGQVEGEARVDLSFPVADINDLIKSMVLRDLDGGHITAVSYDSNAPVERTLRSFAVNLTGQPTLAQILTQARGERVEVALSNAGAGAAAVLNGTIVGMETQRTAVGKDAVSVAVLNLWCADGVRAVKMSDVQRIRFTNPVIESEFKKALETLALSHDTQKKAVSIRCVGEGKRRVSVSYVIENPIWKTSYRLVLGAKAERAQKPYLQGWAVVENPSDEDWKDVRMALVSGRPISFQMDLYQPLYVPRPMVVPELFASLRPVTYSGRLDEEGEPHRASAKDQGKAEDRFEQESAKRKARGRAFGGGRPDADANFGRETMKRLQDRLDLGGSVPAAASAAKLGDFFQYHLDKPVSLPRQKSALLPIVAKDVEGSRVSIYNERTQAKFPLLGLKFKNTSGLHLMQGPITVFEGSTYAGDARILDLQPGEERLLSYAIDLGTEVNPVPSQDGGRIVRLKAVKGVIETSTRQRQGKAYTVKNRSDEERLVLVEHPVNNQFSLVETPKPAETANDFYRFELKVPAGKSRTLTVHEEREFPTTISISTLNDEQIRQFMAQTVISKKVKDGLQQAMRLRWDQAKTTREIEELQRQLNVITADQDRLRKNLKEVPASSPLYKKYLAKLEKQEGQIEKYQEDIKKLQGTEHARKKAFEDFLAAFSAD